MKRVGIILLVMILVTSLGLFSASCKAEEEVAEEEVAEEEEVPAEKLKVVLLTIKIGGTSWLAQLNETIEAEAAANDIELIVYDCENDPVKQLQQMEESITLEPDVIGFVMRDDVATGPVAQKVHEAGIDLVAIQGTLVEEYWDYLTAYIVSDYVAQGATAADVTIEELKKRHGEDVSGTKGCIIAGILTQIAAIERVEGFTERLKQFDPEMEILDQQVGDWQKDKGFNIMEQYLVKYPQIDWLFGSNDGMSLGAAEAAINAGRIDEIIITSVNGDYAGIEGVQQGILATTVLQSPIQTGEIFIDLSLRIGAGEEVPFATMLPNPPITAENVDDYL